MDCGGRGKGCARVLSSGTPVRGLTQRTAAVVLLGRLPPLHSHRPACPCLSLCSHLQSSLHVGLAPHNASGAPHQPSQLPPLVSHPGGGRGGQRARRSGAREVGRAGGGAQGGGGGAPSVLSVRHRGAHRAVGKHQPLQQGVGGQAVGAMQAAARGRSTSWAEMGEGDGGATLLVCTFTGPAAHPGRSHRCRPGCGSDPILLLTCRPPRHTHTGPSRASLPAGPSALRRTGSAGRAPPGWGPEGRVGQGGGRENVRIKTTITGGHTIMSVHKHGASFAPPPLLSASCAALRRTHTPPHPARAAYTPPE